ncbi:MAG: hypothetical protein QMD61_03250 [Methanobacterium sp.]|nr:hypothetical protein [Methanobacterium sp.]
MKLLSLITGFFTIMGVKLLIDNFEIENTIKRVTLFSLIPLIIYFSFFITTPDLLVTCILVYYLYFIFNPKYPDNKFNGLMCGITGALAYLSKSYALPFFLAHFILFNLFFYFKGIDKKKKNRILKNLFIGLIIFSMISGVWIGLISDKYGKITTGTTGEYNYGYVGPESQEIHYLDYIGLIKPPNESAVSAWEDPSYFKMKSWSPFESWDYLKYQINIIFKNIFKFSIIIELFSVLSIIIIIAPIFLITKSKIDTNSKDKLIYLIVTMLLYAGGYLLIYIQERYLWLVNVLLLILGGYVLSLLFKMNYLNNVQKNILLLFLILSFIMGPINGLILDFNIESDFYIYNLSEKLKNDYNFHGNIASNDNFIESDIIAFYTKNKYYGKPKKTIKYNELKNELESNNIDYYLVWGTSKYNNYLSKDFKEITNGTIPNLRIYYLKS